MPVPVSVTHAKGVGLEAQGAAELPTTGPFARLATGGDGATASHGSVAANGDPGRPLSDEPGGTVSSAGSHGEDVAPVLDAGAAAVETCHLRFTYPGIGVRAPGLLPLHHHVPEVALWSMGS